jgi:hypothetical protein
MENIRDLVGGPILPTPGAVMESARLLYDDIGDLLVFDVGGATTDVHSVTEGSPEIASILISPEPLAKRTVEGDLGVYVNIRGIVREIGMEELIREFPDAQSLIDGASPIPHSAEQIRFIETLTYRAVLAALNRHAGTLRDLYGPTGKKTVASVRIYQPLKPLLARAARSPGGRATQRSCKRYWQPITAWGCIPPRTPAYSPTAITSWLRSACCPGVTGRRLCIC